MPDQASEIVAFLGPRATYTHQAALSVFSADKYNLQPRINIADVFSAVQKREVRYGVVPFENSSNGSVIFTLDLFVDAQNRHPDILVEGEIYLPVHHCLLARPARSDCKLASSSSSSSISERDRPLWKFPDEASGSCTPTQAAPIPPKPRVKPNQDISHITKLYSHPQAWGQCKLFLNTYLKGVEQQDVSSTSRAAELVAQDEAGTSAAISSRIAGHVNNLDVLAEGIEDKEGNTTRFFILRHSQDVATASRSDISELNFHAAPPTALDATLDDREEEEEQKYKTLISFTVNNHSEPGALADSLAVFKKFHLNLSSINSRPSTESAWHYMFFVEILGRKLHRGGGGGGKVNRALEELSGVAKEWRWLGSWENKLAAAAAA